MILAERRSVVKGSALCRTADAGLWEAGIWERGGEYAGMMQNSNLDPELTLTFHSSQGGWEAVAAPHGASLRGLFQVGPDGGARREVITGYSGAEQKAGGQGDVLIPFPGRIASGQYTFGGQPLQMDKNDKEGPNAIHGFVRSNLWETTASSPNAVSFATELHESEHPGYPFALGIQVTYRLSESGLTCEFTVENTGSSPAPVAAGFHPYFTLGSALIDTDTLHVPFGAYLEFDDALIPTGNILPVEGTPFDFRSPHPIGDAVLNTCYVQPVRDPDGLLRVRLSGSETQRALTVWMDGAFDYVVLYSGDPLPESHRRRSLAIEPMTCASDAFNHPEWGQVTLVPGETLTGAWGVSAD